MLGNGENEGVYIYIPQPRWTAKFFFIIILSTPPHHDLDVLSYFSSHDILTFTQLLMYNLNKTFKI